MKVKKAKAVTRWSDIPDPEFIQKVRRQPERLSTYQCSRLMGVPESEVMARLASLR